MPHLPLQDSVALLQRSTCIVPRIFEAYPGHPPRCNPNMEALTRDTNEWLEKTLEPGKLLAKLKRSDLPLFCGYIYPDVPYERARTLTYWNIWLFVFDDALDEPTSTYGGDTCKLVEFCAESKEWIRFTLGLTAAGETMAPPQDRRLRHFEDVGLALTASWPVEKRRRLFDELARYIDACVEENGVLTQRGQRVPDLEDFWAIRLGAGGSSIYFQLVEYGLGLDLPDGIWDDAEMKKVLLNLIYDGHSINDVFSLAKELDGESWVNLFVILISQGHAASLQEAVDQIAVWLSHLSLQVEVCTERLAERWAASTGLARLAWEIRRFVDGCRLSCSGNRAFSLQARRYGCIGSVLSEEGRVLLDVRAVLARQRRLIAA